MPLTRLANTAFDGVSVAADAVLEDVLKYSTSDLLCYRADAPERLVERQSEAWDPVLDWARSEIGGRFVLAEGVMHVDQPRETIGAVAIHLRKRVEPFRLALGHRRRPPGSTEVLRSFQALEDQQTGDGSRRRAGRRVHGPFETGEHSDASQYEATGSERAGEAAQPLDQRQVAERLPGSGECPAPS